MNDLVDQLRHKTLTLQEAVNQIQIQGAQNARLIAYMDAVCNEVLQLLDQVKSCQNGEEE